VRFLAAAAVIVNHAPLPPGLPAFFKDFGWAGVDLFLVLSAFLLARLLREELHKAGEIRLGKYFMRRVLRIWPLHWGYVTAMLVIVVATNRFRIQQLGNWLSHIAFVNNWTSVKMGYEGNLPFTAHLWTISLEEQFYLIIPLVVPVLMRQPTRRVAALVCAGMMLLITARTACVLLGTEGGRIPFIWGLPLRADAFILGAGLALGAFDRLSAWMRGDLWIVAGALLFPVANALGNPRDSGWGVPLLYTVTDFACVLVIMGSLSGGVISRALSVRPLRYLGKISFGLYVYHQIAIRMAETLLTKLRLRDDGWELLILAFVITILVSAASYELYEKWFLKLKNRFEIIDSRPA
jgi:peptidoglycan/LPS O-acetylase OafA/YrhL